MKEFGGPLLFLDRSDINTDEIIPARYLTEVTKDALKPYLLEDLSLDGFDPTGPEVRDAGIIVTRENFGCGSSREHAPWSLEVNGIHVVIAESYARIFRQNMFNCGMLAIELSSADIQKIFDLQSRRNLVCDVDIEADTLTFYSGDTLLLTQQYTISDFDRALVKSGGWVEFADSRY
ncbi:MAG: 3-isopropylmalate dehydratase small subunit [Fibrobacterota bacterium]